MLKTVRLKRQTHINIQSDVRSYRYGAKYMNATASGSSQISSAYLPDPSKESANSIFLWQGLRIYGLFLRGLDPAMSKITP